MNALGEGAFPSTRRLAEESALSERTVINHLWKARDLGWLAISEHGFGGKQRRRHEYTIAWPQSVKGIEPASAPSEKKALNMATEAAEPSDAKVLNDVQRSTSGSKSSQGSWGRTPFIPPKVADVPQAQISPPLPGWIPQDAWANFVEMRRRIGKPLSPQTSRLLTPA
jgi:hypothetical protein